MPEPLSDLMRLARQRLFVGRESEQALFREALLADVLPFHILYVWGPGGVGKTALTFSFEEICATLDVPFYRLDARDLEPSAAAFRNALKRTLAPTGETARLADVAAEADRLVLVVDTYEALAPIDRWMCEDFVPMLPGNVLLVLCGRNQRSAEWRSTLGLQELVRPLPLRNLREEDSRRFLRERGVPGDQQEAVLDFAKGYPLALALVADAFDVDPDLDFDPDQTPDVVWTLLRRFLATPMTPAQRRALELSALARSTTQALLAEAFPEEDAGALFDWLRDLSFIEAGSQGLFPHDLARDVLVADVRWRDPEAYHDLVGRIRQYYIDRLREGAEGSVERTLAEYLFLHRDNPVVRPFFEQLSAQWEPDTWTTDNRRRTDLPDLRAALLEHEGEASAALFDRWMERQPEGLSVIRDADGAPAGCLFTVTIDQDVPAEMLEDDPAMRSATQFLEAHAPLRRGEKALLFRFWFDCADYQAISPVQSLIFVERVRHYLNTPNLAYSLLTCADPDFWNPVFTYGDLKRHPEADFEVAGTTYGVYGHDWRQRPPAQWLDLLAQRGSTLQGEHDPPAPTPNLIVLSEPDFADAVKEALKDYANIDALFGNPLLQSRLVLDRVPDDPEYGARAQVLQDVIRSVADELKGTPKEAKYYRALQATYLDPEPTQERAAEALDLPFSTYRRHLRHGIEAVTQALWQREIRG